MKRPMLLPLAPLFRAAVAAKNLAYDKGWATVLRLRGPVVSVGGLSVGGAGKTPLVIRLAQLLQGEGVRVDVLSRGYGRSNTSTQRVDPTGTANDFGDEPVLIARRTNVPVFVGASRFQAGVLAEQAGDAIGAPALHLLDDGFQHRRLARDIDIVLVGQRDLDDYLLPAGNLREPLSALRRASVLVLRDEESHVAAHLRTRGLTQPLWFITRQLEVPVVTGRSLAFCAIARPDDFFAGVRERVEAHQGNLVATLAFPDHHAYSIADIERLVRAAKECGANVFLTTEKDEVKLPGELRSALERVAPVRACRLSIVLQDEQESIRTMIRQLAIAPNSPIV